MPRCLARRDVRPRALPVSRPSDLFQLSLTPPRGPRGISSDSAHYAVSPVLPVLRARYVRERLRIGYKLREYLVSLAAFYRSFTSLSPRGTACLAIHLTKFHPLFCRQKTRRRRRRRRSVGRPAARRVVRSTAITDSWGEISPGANELGQRESRLSREL